MRRPRRRPRNSRGSRARPSGTRRATLPSPASSESGRQPRAPRRCRCRACPGKMRSPSPRRRCGPQTKQSGKRVLAEARRSAARPRPPARSAAARGTSRSSGRRRPRATGPRADASSHSPSPRRVELQRRVERRRRQQAHASRRRCAVDGDAARRRSRRCRSPAVPCSGGDRERRHGVGSGLRQRAAAPALRELRLDALAAARAVPGLPQAPAGAAPRRSGRGHAARRPGGAPTAPASTRRTGSRPRRRRAGRCAPRRRCRHDSSTLRRCAISMIDSAVWTLRMAGSVAVSIAQ